MTITRPSYFGTSADQKIILDLGDIDARWLPVVGGKAANLGELIRAGFAVPPGFCVTTGAYQQVTAGTELGGVLDSLHAPPRSDLVRVAELAGRARAAILAAPVPAAVTAAIVSAYTALGKDVAVAVRSSATAEDLPSASFAGQQDTYLNIIGIEAVVDAVRRCWASLWTDRAVSYRETNDIDHRVVQLAVVVQRMVDARVAGVLFTADPVTGCREHTVIDASPGLGEAVVSGAVNPDHFVVDAGGGIVERRLGDKAVVVRPRPGGGTEQLAKPADGAQPCLGDAQIGALTALGHRVQAHYGTPQDIEWVLDDAAMLWLTQARPITTLYPLPVAATDASPRVYFCISLAQGLTRPITPMGIATFRLMASCVSEVVFGSVVRDQISGPAVLAVAAQRLFIDVTPVLHSRVGRVLIPRVLDVMEARSAVVFRGLFDDPRFAVRTTSWWGFIRRLVALAVRFRIPLRITQALIRPAAARRHVAEVGRKLRSKLAVPEGITAVQRLDHAERLLATTVIPIMPTVVPVAAAGFLAQALVSKLAHDELGPQELDEILRALPYNVTTEMDLQLWALATRFRADGGSAAALRGTAPAGLAARFANRELPPVLQRGLENFLDSYGHRSVAEIDVGMSRWSDDPTHVLGVLANYLRLTDPDLAPDRQFARGAHTAESTVTEVVGRVRRRNRMRAVAVRFALGRVRELVGMRETHKDYLVRVLTHVREQLAAVGAELAVAGRLNEPEDVFFLDLLESRAALAGADLRMVVGRRRVDYERELRRRQIPRIMLSDGTLPEALPFPGQQAGEGQLIGTPASAGTVTAPARVVLDPVGVHLEPGEILVAPSTDPGWTPLFLTAGGLVMEMGGPNSHGAVVAREYGIPAVVGVPEATLRITTGERITVQGAAGLVELE
ncbi:MAG: PEP/pyruvate-binding domain-containing protein [Pseudonocardiaceae bacterium]